MESDVTKVRLAAVTVQPIVMLDDGEHLNPVDTTSMTVPAIQLDELPRLLRDALAKLQSQLDGESSTDLSGAP
jgi:hypothetical protein